MDTQAFVSDAKQEMRNETAMPTPAEREKLLAFGIFIEDFLHAITPVLKKHSRPGSDLDAIFQAVFDPDSGALAEPAANFYITNDQLEYDFRLGDYQYVETLKKCRETLCLAAQPPR